MSRVVNIESITGTMVNVAIFMITLFVFVAVFFFPEYTGMVFAKIIQGFSSVKK
jgi:hypothetical protein